MDSYDGGGYSMYEEAYSAYTTNNATTYNDVDDDEDNLQPELSTYLQEQDTMVWNTKFQKAIEEVKTLSQLKEVPYQKRNQIWNELASLAVDFNYTAQVYGRIIISEVFLPPEKKTIKPITGRGVIGGEKYIINGIMFKFALDVGVFGGDHSAAAKVAGNDLIGLNSYFAADIDGLFYPLMSLVDYRGFRIIALSLLPINRDTLVHGSDDAGLTVTNKDEQAFELLKQAAAKLNTVVHKVVPVRSKVPVEIAGPMDLECHRSASDNRLYVLDFSRAMPPQSQKVTEKAGFTTSKGFTLTRLLRPEFVAQYPKPLCADVFCKILRYPPNSNVDEAKMQEMLALKKKYEDDVDEATLHLFHSAVPKLAAWLSETFANKIKLNLAEYRHVVEGDWLTILFHYHGVNMRFIRLVISHLPDNTPDYIRLWLYVEAIARTLKNMLRTRMRLAMIELKYTGEEPYKQVAVKFLNQVFGLHENSLVFWNTELKAKMNEWYPAEINPPEEMDLKMYLFNKPVLYPESDTRIYGASMLFRRLSELAGIAFSPATEEQFATSPALFDVEQPFDTLDIVALRERSKTLQIVSHSLGVVLRMRAAAVESKLGSKLSESFCAQALDKFQQSLRSVSRDRRTWRNVAEVFERLKFFNLAELCYELALLVNPLDSVTLYKYGTFIERVQCDDARAGSMYKLSSELPDATPGSIVKYADFCSARNDLDTAKELYERTVTLYPDLSFVWHKLAVFCEKTGAYDRAEEAYKKAISIDNSDDMLLEQYALFLKNIKHDNDGYEKYYKLFVKRRSERNFQFRSTRFYDR